LVGSIDDVRRRVRVGVVDNRFLYDYEINFLFLILS
jgi:hypothetical protein